MEVFEQSTPKVTGSFKNWVKDYLKNSTIAGCAYYVTPQTGPKERFFWLVIHIASILLLIATVWSPTISYMKHPTVTTEVEKGTPLQHVYFPGVAICDVNKISHSRAVDVAEEIMEYHSWGNLTLRELTNALKYLGHLYLFELNEGEEDRVDLLHKLLLRRYKRYVPHLLRRLGTPCQRILQYCSWAGKEYSCEDIFFTRKTADGYCCTFNYARPSEDFGGKDTKDGNLHAGGIERILSTGPKFGLTVLLNSDHGDHHYKILPILGYKISIFASLDYPDAPSGTLREVLVSSGTHASLNVKATAFYTTKEVSGYNADKRGCLFSNELALRFGGYYSYSDCIMYCRVSDILRLCHCIPFFYPTPTSDDKMRTCDLQDLPCLKQYKNKWWRVRPPFEIPMGAYNDSLAQGSNGTLNCSECLPACEDVTYDVSGHFAPLNSLETFMDREGTTFQNNSLVNIFFIGGGSRVRLEQDVLFRWYDLMSNYGGVCGLFLGISIISIVEFFYFFTLRLYKGKDDKEKGSSRLTSVKAAKPSLRPLYWHEMIQPNAKY